MRCFIPVVLTSVLTAPAFAQDSNPTSLPKEICNLEGEQSIVPNLLGFAPEVAQKLVEDCGFVYDGATDVHTLSYEAIGTVGDQEPSGGELEKKGSVVRGFVSVGVYPPSFVGLEADLAEAFYRDLRHGVNRTFERNPAPVGTVIRQSPSNSELYNSGLPLNLVVSDGLYVDVPQVIGMEYGLAKRLLEEQGLIVLHGGGYLDYQTEWFTNCEYIDHFPVVSAANPVGRLYEGDSITLATIEETEVVLLSEPPGTGVVGQEPKPSICQ